MNTLAQQSRQRARNSAGRYEEHYPCFRCGKSAGADYTSDRRTDEVLSSGYRVDDRALCLCLPCGAHTNALGDDAFEAELRDSRWGQMTRPRPKRDGAA